MRKTKKLLYHGGVSGLIRGVVILPDMAHARCVAGCPVCAAHARGEDHELDPATPQGWVYATSNRRYGRFHASKCVRGDLYKVELLGDVEDSTEDGPFPAWRGRRAIIERVVERGIELTQRERLDLWRRWGGSESEFRSMLRGAAYSFDPYSALGPPREHAPVISSPCRRVQA